MDHGAITVISKSEFSGNVGQYTKHLCIRRKCDTSKDRHSVRKLAGAVVTEIKLGSGKLTLSLDSEIEDTSMKRF